MSRQKNLDPTADALDPPDPGVLSLMSKRIREISVGGQMEGFVSVDSDRNFRGHLWRFTGPEKFAALIYFDKSVH